MVIKIIVYGVGTAGKDFIQYTQELSFEIEIIGVSDSYINRQELNPDSNISIIEAIDIPNFVFDYIVVTPKYYYSEIKNFLVNLGIDEMKIKSIKDIYRDYGKFYGDNLNGKKYFCNLCEGDIVEWHYIGFDYPIFQGKKIVGGSRRRGRCPVCGGSDRERYVYHVLKKYTNLIDGSQHSVLHFAPEDFLSKKLRKLCQNRYISADIIPGRADIVADITELQFENEMFEYIICNHVMEHVLLEQRAFFEIRRCLSKTGILILTVPICWEQKTFENSSIITDADRIKWYGQKDHVRLYGNDIAERIRKFGFDVTVLYCKKIMDENSIYRYGFIPEDAVLLCKNNNSL